MKELPDRKNLRLKGYDYSEKGVYFITICTKNRKNILSKISLETDTHISPIPELTRCGKIVQKYVEGINGIEHYVIMPNHIHLLINNYIGTDISSRIKTFKTLVTKELGKSIWQASFYDHIIRDDEDYAIKYEYIDNNPHTWFEDKLYNAGVTDYDIY